MNKIRAAFESRGFRVEYRKNSDAERLKSATRRGYSLFNMDHPFHPRALTLRKAYFYPFWRIERSAKRWEWDIAKTPFDPDSIDAAAATQFCDYWRRQLFIDLGDTTPQRMVYIPLQGRLLEKRGFQHASPLDMIRDVLAYDTGRDIVTGLHPRETYLADETDALESLVDDSPRLRLSSEPMQSLLERADYVVTENSSVALNGYFLGKPAVLFAQIDFPHIAANVADLGAQKAITSAPGLHPDYDKYLYWFLKLTSINGGAPDTESQVLNRVRALGWQV